MELNLLCTKSTPYAGGAKHVNTFKQGVDIPGIGLVEVKESKSWCLRSPSSALGNTIKLTLSQDKQTATIGGHLFDVEEEEFEGTDGGTYSAYWLYLKG